MPDGTNSTDTRARVLGRFTIDRVIGAGASGVVHEAVDQLDGSRVALKVIRRTSPDALYLFKREFRLARHIAHPCLVRLFELRLDVTPPFYTMELIRGSPLDVYVQESDLGPDALRSLLGKLAQGIDRLHEAGVLHRDIKPQNVLVRPDGTPVLLDFGLSIADSVAARGSQRRWAVGTPGFMPPEQLWRLPQSPASDWFSFSATVLTAISGKSLPSELDPRHAARALTTSARLPQMCIDLMVALLDPDPASRPTGPDVLAALVEGPTAHRAAPSELPFVGRTAELEVLQSSLESGKSAGAIVLRGASGAGKSALLAEATRRAVESGCIVLRARCDPGESVPFNALDGIVDDLSRALMDHPEAVPSTADLPPPETRELVRLFPVLLRVPELSLRSAGSSGPEPEDAARVHLAGAGLASLLATLGRHRSLAVIIDDVHWGDRDSAGLLRGILERLRRRAVSFVFGARDPEYASSPVGESLAQVDRRVPIIELALRPLHPDDAASLTRAAGLPADMTFPDEVLASPLLLCELLRAGVANADLDSLLAARIDVLPPTARDLLVVLALAGAPLALRAARGDDRGGTNDVAHLLEVRLVREVHWATGRALIPFHDSVRELTIRRTSPEHRRKVHLTIAARLRESGDPRMDLVAKHLAAGGESVEAGRAALEAGHRAFAQAAFEQASRLLRTAMEHHPGLATAGTLEALAEANAARNAHREAASNFDDAAKLVDAPSERRRLLRRAAEQHARCGAFAESCALLPGYLVPLGERLPAHVVDALGEICVNRLRLAARGLDYRDAGSESQPDGGRLEALWSAATNAWSYDPLLGEVLMTRHLLGVLDGGGYGAAARSLASNAALIQRFFGSALAQPGGKASLQRATDLAERHGSIRDRAWVAMCATLVSWLECADRSTIIEADRTAALLEAHGVGTHWELQSCRSWKIGAMWHQLQLREALELTARVLDLSRRAKQHWALDVVGVFHPAALRQLAADRPSDARALLGAVEERYADDMPGVGQYAMGQAWAEVCLYEGRSREAASHLERCRPYMRDAGATLVTRVRTDGIVRNAVVRASLEPGWSPALGRELTRMAARLRPLEVSYVRSAKELVSAIAARPEKTPSAARPGPGRPGRAASPSVGSPLWHLVATLSSGETAAYEVFAREGVVRPRRFARLFLPEWLLPELPQP